MESDKKLFKKTATKRTVTKTVTSSSSSSGTMTSADGQQVVCSNESMSMSASSPFSKTIVIFKSLIRVEGILDLKAKSDGTTLSITTDKGTVTITQPGKYIINEQTSFQPRLMTADEATKAMEGLKPDDKKKLLA